MAGWRARRGGDEPVATGEPVEPVEPIELVDDGSSPAEASGGQPVDWHAVVRTGAAVVAAVSLLWIGRSLADEHRHREQTSCASEMQSAMWRYENGAARRPSIGPPTIPDDVYDRLIGHARDCGDDLFADALEYERQALAEDR